ncbi:glycosyltransferase family 4 protein [Acinetobacter sp. XS-4]|uniref:glycosyltransferase family 4 protein n=1 Tax=Acinetobacter sp. XS-4 TaxID=2923375 RepID=UPI00208E41A7|nr:glycosyltransferase family 4 protein [Acinetobacter sp. XS-4]USP42451.1 glycosyltransferase family 4 protein [Acinetobacter sp. XS-4]
MKFLMISSFLPSVLNFRGKLLEAIHHQGYEIHIIAPDLELFQPELDKLKSLGYSVYSVEMQRTGTNPIADIKTLFEIYKIIKKIQPDYVLSYTIKPVIYGTLATYLAKVPNRFSLITGLGYAFQNVDGTSKRSTFQKIVHWLYKQALIRSSKVFFQNPDDLALFQQLNLLSNKVPAVVVNGSGVNVTDFEVVGLPRTLNGDVKVSFLLIARLLEDKGIREYVEAAKLIKKEYPQIEFNLVGWIDENPTAIKQQELDSWIDEKIIKYWGKLSDVRPAIAETSIYVLPSYREGTPRTVLEAMSMGRAIITTDAPGCRETVEHDGNGYLVEVKSVTSLEMAMKKFIQNPELAEIMGTRSREIALYKYDVHQVNHHMMTEMGIK